MAESEEELKSLLMKVKEERKKSWLKTQHSSIWQNQYNIVKLKNKIKYIKKKKRKKKLNSENEHHGIRSHAAAAVAAKLLQSCPTLCDPIDGSPPSSPVPGILQAMTSWQIDGETMETVTDFIFLGSKITADGYCSHEIKRHLLLEEKL